MFDNSNKYLQFIGGFLALGFTLLQGIDWVFRKFEIDSFYFNLILIILLIFHIVGKLDATLGYEDVYLPWKKLVGTDLKDLRTLELDGFGHGIPKDTIVKYHKSWIEKYSVE